MSLKFKMIAFCLLVGMVPVTVMGVFAVKRAADSLSELAFGRVEAVRDAKKAAVEAMAEKWLADVRIYAGVKEVYHAVAMGRDAFMGVKPGVRADVADPAYLDTRNFVIAAFKPFVEVLGYEDALVVDDYGRVLFSVANGAEVGEDVKAGPLKDSGLGRAFQKGLTGQAVFADFAPYAPLGGEPAAFVAAPIRDHVGKVEAVAVLRVPRARLAGIMELRTGMGETGESFLVGGEGLMRSDSFRAADTHSLRASFAAPHTGKVATKAATSALSGETGTALTEDFRGVPVLSGFAPVTVGDVTWALLAETDEEEALAAASDLGLAAMGLGAATIVAVLAATVYFLRRELLSPFAAIRTYLRQSAEGDLSAELPGRFKSEMAEIRGGLLEMTGELKVKLGFAESVLKAMTVPCLVANSKNRLTFVNAPLLDLFQEPGDPESLHGRDLEDFLRGLGDGGIMAEGCLSCREDRAVCGLTAAGRGRRGREFHVRLDAAPLYDLDDNRIGMFVLFTDLTDITAQAERVRAQHELVSGMAARADRIAKGVSAEARDLSQLVESAAGGAAAQTRRLGDVSGLGESAQATLDTAAGQATEAARRAEDSMGTAKSGAEDMSRSMEAMARIAALTATLREDMGELGEKAGAIGHVVEVISDIADQTNLLALNAAIEAARAGDAGRGFAVVADEVRKLAEKTMAATREVGSSVRAIQESARRNVTGARQAADSVDEARELVSRCGEVFSVIVEASGQTAARVTDIAASLADQARVHEDILRAVAEVGEVARQTAGGMSGAAEAVASLAGEAGELEELIREMRREGAGEGAEQPGNAPARRPDRLPGGNGSSPGGQRAALAATEVSPTAMKLPGALTGMRSGARSHMSGFTAASLS
jgi:methyl-accepting chemotaxis protein